VSQVKLVQPILAAAGSLPGSFQPDAADKPEASFLKSQLQSSSYFVLRRI
jgi:hypothetical protein